MSKNHKLQKNGTIFQVTMPEYIKRNRGLNVGDKLEWVLDNKTGKWAIVKAE